LRYQEDILQRIPKKERQRNPESPIYNRGLLLHGPKRNEMLKLGEIEQYGLDSFGEADSICIYGMKSREWYGCGIRLLGRTAVECTRDVLADRIARDIASFARCMSSDRLVVIDPFAGSCNTLFWILRHLPRSKGIAFESDKQVFELTLRNLAALSKTIELVHCDCARLVAEYRVENEVSSSSLLPTWGTALDEEEGLDLCRTTPPIAKTIDEVVQGFLKNQIFFAIQVYEKVSAPSLSQIRAMLDWSESRIYHINQRGNNHGILLGTKHWAPTR
jgi:hypothetical protein